MATTQTHYLVILYSTARTHTLHYCSELCFNFKECAYSTNQVPHLGHSSTQLSASHYKVRPNQCHQMKSQNSDLFQVNVAESTSDSVGRLHRAIQFLSMTAFLMLLKLQIKSQTCFIFPNFIGHLRLTIEC